MSTTLRRILGRKVRVDAMIEFALIMAIPYIVIGLAFTFFHPDDVAQIEAQAQRLLPAGAYVAAFGETTLLWPMLIFTPAASVSCTAAGSANR